MNAIMGASGTGKSTLFEIMTGLKKVDENVVHATVRPVLALQECEEAIFEAYAADDVAFGPRNKGITGKKLKDIVRKSMDAVGLPFDQFKDRRTQELSGGEKRRLSLAGIISLDSEILIFDEPTAGLDPNGRYQILSLLQQLALEGKTIIYSTHRSEEAKCANRTIVLGNKNILSDTESNINKKEEEVSLQDVKPVSNIGLLQKLNNASLGLFQEKKSIIHNLPPVAKYLIFLLVFIPGIAFRNYYLLGIMVGLSVIYSLLAKVPIKKTLVTILKLLPWLLFFTILQFLFFPVQKGDTVLWKIGFIAISVDKIDVMIRTFFHLIAAIFCVFTFLYSTSENDIILEIGRAHV